MKQESASMEDFKQLLKELELLQKEQAAEEKELIYLRWSNACLRHEIRRNHTHLQEDHENHDRLMMKTDSSELEAAEEETEHRNCISDQEAVSSTIKSGTKHFSKRKKLLQKLRRWVGGNDNDHCRAKVIFGVVEEHQIVRLIRLCSSA